jgi:hypothetical protein
MFRKLSGKFASGLETQLKSAGEMSLARLRVFSEQKLSRVASRNALLRFDFIFIYMVAKVRWVAKNHTSHESSAESQMNISTLGCS